MKAVTKQCVGIDISKATFSACVCSVNVDQDVRFSPVACFENSKQGFNQLDKWVKKQIDKRVTTVYLMEATGVYYESLAYHLHKIKKTVHVVLANKAKHYLASLNLKTKTDAVDAKGLAQFGVERKFSPWQPPKAVYKKLREVTRHRTGLQQAKVSLSNQLSAIRSSEQGDKFVQKSLEAVIKKVTGQMDKCELEIKAIIKSDEQLQEKMKKLISITGVGLLSASIVVAETGGFEQFKSIKQLVSFAGMDVVQRQSGTSLKGKTKISKKGNSHIRRVLHFPALSAVQHNPVFKRLYARHLENGKKRMVAIVAVQRKILSLIFTLWKNDSFFIEDYESLNSSNKIAPADAEATQDNTQMTASFDVV